MSQLGGRNRQVQHRFCRLTHLNEVSRYQLSLGGWNQVIENFPPLPKAELHDISVDGGRVVGWGEPCEEDTVLCAIGCEAPWWSKKHQRFSGTQRRACGPQCQFRKGKTDMLILKTSEEQLRSISHP